MTDDIYSDEPSEFCEIQCCENSVSETQPASRDLTTLTTRKLCFPCGEAFNIGCQHANFRAVRDLLRKGFREAAELLLGRALTDGEIEQVKGIDPGDEWGG
jgi:hypothetical protein